MIQNIKDHLLLLTGITGAIITFAGLFTAPSQIFYVLGSTLLLITASKARLIFFIALELILIAGHGVVLLDIGPVTQLTLPILLCLQLLFFYFLSGQLNNGFLLIGIAGIAALSVGLSYVNQWIFLFGSSAVALYSLYYARKNKLALIWGVLNTLFAATALYKLVQG